MKDKHDHKLFSLSAVMVGYLLVSDLTPTEQNTLGNWLMLVGQFVSTSAYYAALQEEREDNKEKESNKNEDESTLKMLEKMIKALQTEVNDLKEKK